MHIMYACMHACRYVRALHTESGVRAHTHAKLQNKTPEELRTQSHLQPLCICTVLCREHGQWITEMNMVIKCCNNRGSTGNNEYCKVHTTFQLPLHGCRQVRSQTEPLPSLRYVRTYIMYSGTLDLHALNVHTYIHTSRMWV